MSILAAELSVLKRLVIRIPREATLTQILSEDSIARQVARCRVLHIADSEIKAVILAAERE